MNEDTCGLFNMFHIWARNVYVHAVFVNGHYIAN